MSTVTRPKTRRDIDVEALLVWVYRDQRADRIVDRGIGLQYHEAMADGVEVQLTSADGCARVEGLGLLGTKVDGGGFGAGDLDADAETVHLVVRRLWPDHPAALLLVLQHARQGSRPDWMPNAQPRLVPVRRPGGKPIVEYIDPNRHYGFCPLLQLNGGSAVLQARQEYQCWHLGLRAVASALATYAVPLQRYRVVGPAVNPQPWMSRLTS